MAQEPEAAIARPRRPMTAATRIRTINDYVSYFFPGLLVVAVIALVIGVAEQSGVNTAIAQVQAGLVIGAIYALIAVGYTMVYGIIELINFAHGDVFTLSAFYSVLIAQGLGWVGVDLDSLATHNVGGLGLALIILLPLTMIAAGITGVLIERIAYRRLRDAPRLAPLITAIGVSFILEGVMFAKFGSANYPTHRLGWVTGTAITIDGVDISWTSVFVFGTALVMMFALSSFVNVTRLGKAMRATAQDRDAALLSGININRTVAATFFIGSAMAAAAAIVYTVEYPVVQWNLGFRVGIIAFTSAVLGGIGNIVGAGLGGFLIGIIAVLGGQLINQEWSDSIIFGMLIIVLTFRPVGLLGMRVSDRA